jgi:2-hydroxychromene-2-carboxylate isomerase
VHRALFAARHDEGRDIRERDVLAEVLKANGVDDADDIFAEVDTGARLAEYRKIHEQLEAENRVFGVPTFIADDRAVFVRIMDRPNGDGAHGTTTIERVLDLLQWTELNEFKHTKIPR